MQQVSVMGLELKPHVRPTAENEGFSEAGVGPQSEEAIITKIKIPNVHCHCLLAKYTICH